MGLPYHSEELAYCATHKFAMREKARAIGLGVPRYTLVDSLKDAVRETQHTGFPLVIKPVDSFSSRGVSVVHNQDELRQVFPQSLAASFEKKILLEEFMVGAEGSVEALVRNGVPH